MINWDTSGYDHYLQFQYRQCGDFVKQLFICIAQADDNNRARLSKAFPSHVEAYETWTQKGAQKFLSKCSDTPLVKRMLEEIGAES